MPSSVFQAPKSRRVVVPDVSPGWLGHGVKRESSEMDRSASTSRKCSSSAHPQRLPSPPLSPDSTCTTTEPTLKKRKAESTESLLSKLAVAAAATSSPPKWKSLPRQVQTLDCVEWYSHQEKGSKDRQRYKIPLCLDCFSLLRKDQKDRHDEETSCRFRGSYLRILQPDASPEKKVRKLNVVGVLSEKDKVRLRGDAYNPARFSGGPSISHLTAQERLYILENVFPTLESLVKQERAFLGQYSPADIAMKTPLDEFRESCDVCLTSIFNVHFLCQYCAFTICVDCYADRDMRRENGVNDDFYRPPPLKPASCLEELPRDGQNWPACPSNPSFLFPKDLRRLPADLKKIPFDRWPHHLIPAHFLPFSVLDKLFHHGRKMKNEAVKSRAGRAEPSTDRLATPSSNSDYLCKGQLLWLKQDSTSAQNMQAFRRHWKEGLPVLISRITSQLKEQALWLPEAFARTFGKEAVTLVDCSTKAQTEYHNMKHSHFWDGFDDFDARSVNEDGRPALWKIKDWPTRGNFADILPEHYKDLMEALPINCYTNNLGDFNLAKYLPKWCNPPDLGPKMYAAYGCSTNAKLATTNLHVDICDAVNVIVHVGCPRGEGSQQAEESIATVLDELELDESVRNRLALGERPGAIWQIYAPDDADTVRLFIRKMRRERGQHSQDDPIHCQMEYLDAELRQKLERETGVHSIDIVQFEGDGIFIPANAPHQVCNLHSCIKVAEDFVTPEHVAECVYLTKEFRKLPNDFSNKPDKLQMKSILFHTVKAIAASFRRDKKPVAGS